MLARDDGVALLRLVGEAAEESPDYRGRLHRVLNGLSTMVEAPLASGGVLTGHGPGRAASVETHITVGDWSRSVVEFAHPSNRNGEADGDPAFTLALRRLGDGAVTLCREDLLDDKSWYASDHVRRRLEVGLDGVLYSGLYAGAPGEYHLLIFHRARGQSAFGTRDVELVNALHGSLGWLLRVWRREREVLAVWEGLPPRMRATLACLQHGDSEKQAAQRLGVSPHTLHEYVKKLHKRFGVKSRGELLAKCQQMRLSATLPERAQRDGGWGGADGHGRHHDGVSRDPDAG